MFISSTIITTVVTSVLWPHLVVQPYGGDIPTWVYCNGYISFISVISYPFIVPTFKPQAVLQSYPLLKKTPVSDAIFSVGAETGTHWCEGETGRVREVHTGKHIII